MAKPQYFTEIGIRRRRFRILTAFLKTIGGSAVAFAIVAGFLIYFPLFRVRSVRVEGLTYIPEEKVQSLIRARAMAGSTVEHFLGLRNMLVWPSRMTKEDLVFLPEASGITIDKNYWRGSVEVKVSERPHHAIWCFRAVDPSRCYWFDEAGLITRTPYTEGSLMLVINDHARSSIPSGEPVIKKEHLDNLFTIFNALDQMEVTAKEIRLENLALEEVKVPTFSGPTLLFSLRFPANNTPPAFDALAEKTKIGDLEYIDFRVENRIYYR